MRISKVYDLADRPMAPVQGRESEPIMDGAEVGSPVSRRAISLSPPIGRLIRCDDWCLTGNDRSMEAAQEKGCLVRPVSIYGNARLTLWNNLRYGSTSG